MDCGTALSSNVAGGSGIVPWQRKGDTGYASHMFAIYEQVVASRLPNFL